MSSTLAVGQIWCSHDDMVSFDDDDDAVDDDVDDDDDEDDGDHVNNNIDPNHSCPQHLPLVKYGLVMVGHDQ